MFFSTVQHIIHYSVYLVGWDSPAVEDSDTETTVTLNRAVRGLPSSCTPTETH